MRVTWLTDIHLNFLSPVGMEKFFSLVRGSKPDVILISGDIGEASRLEWYLGRLQSRLQRPIYFVLGNHDFYGSSFAEVRAVMARLSAQSNGLQWLPQSRIVELTPQTALVGHDSWADGRLGNYALSDVLLNDYVFIKDLSGVSKDERLHQLNMLGDEAAAYCREWLPKALDHYPHVYFVTHVPPFREACWHQGQLSDDNYLPHFACQAVGAALAEIMSTRPDRQLTVLCGHTHSPGSAQICDNLLVLTGEADYGVPLIQKVFEIE
jgi:3',5'-cyclic-AMP phosphodiesterase